MFVAGVIISGDIEDRLRSIGVKDSKLLTPKARAKLFTLICMYSRSVIVLRVPPKDIDKSNLNELFIRAVSNIVRAAFTNPTLRGEIREIVIDAASGSAKLMKEINNLLSRLGIDKVNLIIESKADLKYTVVSAASIVAKYLRDTHIKILHEIYGDFGSGYPSDPKTKAWLLKLKAREIPPIVRKSWSTLKKLGIRYVNEDQTLLKWLKGKR